MSVHIHTLTATKPRRNRSQERHAVWTVEEKGGRREEGRQAGGWAVTHRDCRLGSSHSASAGMPRSWLFCSILQGEEGVCRTPGMWSWGSSRAPPPQAQPQSPESWPGPRPLVGLQRLSRLCGLCTGQGGVSEGEAELKRTMEQKKQRHVGGSEGQKSELAILLAFGQEGCGETRVSSPGLISLSVHLRG